MSSTLTVQEVANRLSQFPHDRYLYIGGFMRSVALAAGTYVLLEILLDLKRYKLRLLPWTAALLATMITLTTWGRGVLLTNSRANLFDAVLPTLMGIAEFCLFAILAPRKNSDSVVLSRGLETWHFWPFFNAAHVGLAVLLIWNRIYNTDTVKDYVPELRPLADKYMDWMRGDRIGAGVTTVILIVIGFVTLRLARKASEHPGRKRYWRTYAVLSILPIIIYINVIRMAEDQRQQTDQYVFDLKSAPNPSPSPPCQQILDDMRRAICH